MEQVKKPSKKDLVLGLLQMADFLLHDAEFFVYQKLKQSEWIKEEQENLSDDDFARLDLQLRKIFKEQHDTLSELLSKIDVDLEAIKKLTEDKK